MQNSISDFCEKFSKLLAFLKIICYNIFVDIYTVFFVAAAM